jgi:hypothetical protein
MKKKMIPRRVKRKAGGGIIRKYAIGGGIKKIQRTGKHWNPTIG